MTVMTTYSRLKIDPADPKPESICLRDIAHALSQQARFCGQLDTFYSVASHCLMVGELLAREFNAPHLEIHGPLHDGHEAYISDIPTPVKELLGPEIYKVEANLDRAIYAHFGVELPTASEKIIIKKADRLAFLIEDHYLRDGAMTQDNDEYNSLFLRYSPVELENVETLFINKVKKLLLIKSHRL